MPGILRRSPFCRPAAESGGGASTFADPTQLLAASGQSELGAAYNALNVSSLAVGGSYADPTTARAIVRLTNASFPAANTLCVPPYWEGGAILSYPWGDSGEMRTVLILARGASGSTRLVDWNTVTNAVTNSRVAPGSAGELNCGFSLDPDTPQRLITLSGGNLRSYNTATGALVETIRTGLANSGIPWLTIGKLDRRFTWQVSGTATVYAYDRDTDTVISRVIADLDEVKFDKSRYAWVRGEGRAAVWDVQENTLTSFATDGGANPDYMGHAGVVPGFAFGCGNNGAGDGVWRCDLAASAIAGSPQLGQSSIVSACEINCCGLWVDQDPAATMWGVVAGNQVVCSLSGQRYNDGIGLHRLDGSEFRLLCHHYNTGSANESGYYGAYGWPNISPDGKVVVFVSNMNGQSRTDLFGVLLPVSA